MKDIVDELREAQRDYERCGVHGSEGARIVAKAADEIERLRNGLKEMSGFECTCHPAYYERGLIAPDCLAHLCSDGARILLGEEPRCRGRQGALAK